MTRALRVGGGTALPGLVALKLSSGILTSLLRAIPNGFVFVTGTNGKTTTVAMLSRILSIAGYDVLTNRTGSNLSRGLVSQLVQRTSALGRLNVGQDSIGVFEVDEAAFIDILPSLQPRLVLFTNLFRDQLDRYGEIDAISNEWGRVITAAGENLQIVLNADDPTVMRAGTRGIGKVSTFGVRNGWSVDVPDEWADSVSCPRCSTQLTYRGLNYSHLGDYLCPGCGFERMDADFDVTKFHVDGLEPASFCLPYKGAQAHIKLNLPGLFNVYNALAAATAAATLDVPVEAVQLGLEKFEPAFGRSEQIWVDGVEMVLLLIKNPAGANEVMRSLRQETRPTDYLIVLNDRPADGEDISWIWDIDFDKLCPKRIIVSGDRAEDLALRLKYANLKQTAPLIIEANRDKALSRALEGGAARVNVLATYTAMLELRSLLVRRGCLTPYWYE